MSQNPEEFTYREYNGRAEDADYAHPAYYQRAASPPVVPDPYKQVEKQSPAYTMPTAYEPQAATNAPVPNPYEQVQEYRGPQSLERYQATEQAGEAQAQTVETKSGKRGTAAGVGGSVATLAVLLLKFGGALITALISIVIYAAAFGWKFAVGLVALLFIHEMGHALVMKLKGIPVGGLIFIPLMGAAVTMRNMPQNARDEAEVGIAGPIAGALASSLCLWLAFLPGSDPVWAPLAYFGFFLNLFNLAPIVPLDGGRVIGALDRRIWIIGFIGLLGLQIWEWVHGSFSPWLLLILVVAATQLWSRSGGGLVPNPQTYYKVSITNRVIIAILYFGLAAALFFGMSVTHNIMPLSPSGGWW